jgi:DNA-binding protein HU-beta
MTNSDLANAIAAAHGTTKAEGRKIVDTVFTTIAEAAAKGDEVALNQFGKFKVTRRPARDGRNPRTGETITIAASKKVGFTAAKALKDRLND